MVTRPRQVWARTAGRLGRVARAAGVAALAFGASLPAPGLAAAERFSGLGYVQDDGTLVVDGRHVRLFGIDIPLDERDCRTFLRPVRCAPRSVLVLDNKVTGFVHCTTIQRYRDGSVAAQCTVPAAGLTEPEIDLAAYLLREGWAFAAEDAPARYRQLERLAAARGRGMWIEGFVDVR